MFPTYDGKVLKNNGTGFIRNYIDLIDKLN